MTKTAWHKRKHSVSEADVRAFIRDATTLIAGLRADLAACRKALHYIGRPGREEWLNEPSYREALRLYDAALAPLTDAQLERWKTGQGAHRHTVLDQRMRERIEADRAEIAHLTAELAACRTAVEPVWDWFESEELPAPRLPDVIAAVVADLLADRAETIRLRTELAACRARLGEMVVLVLQTSGDIGLLDLAGRTPIGFVDGAPVAFLGNKEEEHG